MKLSLREKFIVFGGLALVLAAAFWAMVYDPVTAKVSLLDKKLDYERKRYAQLSSMSKKMTSLNAALKVAEKRVDRGDNFSILSHLEVLANSQGLKAHVVQMKPKAGQNTRHFKESVVEIKMEKVTLPQMTGYLHEVENGREPLRIKDLRIKPRFDNPDLLDANVDIASYQLSR